jgi:hypothetical protein
MDPVQIGRPYASPPTEVTLALGRCYGNHSFSVLSVCRA